MKLDNTASINRLHLLQEQALQIKKDMCEELRKKNVYIEPYQVRNYFINLKVERFLNKMFPDYLNSTQFDYDKDKQVRKLRAIAEVQAQYLFDVKYPTHGYNGEIEQLPYGVNTDVKLFESDNIDLKRYISQIIFAAKNKGLCYVNYKPFAETEKTIKKQEPLFISDVF